MLRSAWILGVLCFFWFAFPAAAESPVGEVVATMGSPSASGPGGDRGLVAGSAVYEADRITTGNGNVQIVFIDNTRLLIGPQSTLVIERFLLRGGRTVRKLSIDALRGTFRFISGNSRKSAYNLTTANATITLHGTAFDVSAGGSTVIAVYDGKAGLCTRGQCAEVREKCGVARARGGNVTELTGRAKALALEKLPYLSGQGRLARPFRLDTSACLTLVSIPRDESNRGSHRNGISTRAPKDEPETPTPRPQ
jgi:hypothetical protein